MISEYEKTIMQKQWENERDPQRQKMEREEKTKDFFERNAYTMTFFIDYYPYKYRMNAMRIKQLIAELKEDEDGSKYADTMKEMEDFVTFEIYVDRFYEEITDEFQEDAEDEFYGW